MERTPGSKAGWCWDLNFYNLLTLFRCQFCPKNLYKQQQKLFQQQRIVQSQRLKRVRQLLEDHTKNLQDLQRSHEAQQVTVQEQLRKEINMLQKKILTDTVRRSRGDVMVTSRFLEQNCYKVNTKYSSVFLSFPFESSMHEEFRVSLNGATKHDTFLVLNVSTTGFKEMA